MPDIPRHIPGAGTSNSEPESRKGKKYIFGIGISDYADVWGKLPNAVKDLRDFRKLLLERYEFDACGVKCIEIIGERICQTASGQTCAKFFRIKEAVLIEFTITPPCAMQTRRFHNLLFVVFAQITVRVKNSITSASRNNGQDFNYRPLPACVSFQTHDLTNSERGRR